MTPEAKASSSRTATSAADWSSTSALASIASRWVIPISLVPRARGRTSFERGPSGIDRGRRRPPLVLFHRSPAWIHVRPDLGREDASPRELQPLLSPDRDRPRFLPEPEWTRRGPFSIRRRERQSRTGSGRDRSRNTPCREPTGAERDRPRIVQPRTNELAQPGRNGPGLASR
jgi:hypothetical protein